MKKLSKLILSVMMACSLLISVMPLKVEAALTTPQTVNDEYVLRRLSELAGKLGVNSGNLEEGDGIYFTVNQKPCGSGLSSHGCSNCSNSNVANTQWFKDIFGTVSVGGFPKQYGDDGVAGTHTGRSCWGFANFAMWYATSTSNTDNVIGTLVGTSTFTKENILRLLRPGYIIRCGGHSMVFISANENTMKVMDCNYRPGYDVTNCRVRIREFGYTEGEFNYFKGKKMGITRAGNYDTNSTGDTTPPVLSSYIKDVDSSGYTLVCKAVDNVGMGRVCFPTWTTANGQDDLNPDWYNKSAIVGKGDDGVYIYRVNTADHNNEYGEYVTHVYAYDVMGNYICAQLSPVYVPSPNSLPFPDVKPGAWYYDSVAEVYAAGLMNGRADGTFGPNLNLTRAEVATVLYNMENKPATTYIQHFSDVKEGMWYSIPISWAFQNSVVSGYANGKYGVADNITREQMAQMLFAYARMKGYDISYTDGLINQYGDSNKVSNWAKPAMNWAISKGIMSGKGSGGDLSQYKLEPLGNTTRAECAAMLKNFMKVYGR